MSESDSKKHDSIGIQETIKAAFSAAPAITTHKYCTLGLNEHLQYVTEKRKCAMRPIAQLIDLL